MLAAGRQVASEEGIDRGRRQRQGPHRSAPSLRGALRPRAPLLAASIGATLALSGCSRQAAPEAPPVGADPVVDLVRDEEWLLAQTPRLRALERALASLDWPGEAAALFAEDAAGTAFVPSPGDALRVHETVAVAERTWSVRDRPPLEEGGPFAAWIADARFFDHAAVAFVRARHADLDTVEAELLVHALWERREGGLRAAGGRIDVRFRAEGDPSDEPTEEAARWRIVSFAPREAAVLDAPGPLFEDVLDRLVPDDETRRFLRRSIHEEKVVELFREGRTRLPKPEYAASFAPDALGQHPAVSVADVDGDGRDDLYVMPRWGRNRLLVRAPDGTLRDEAERFGLDVRGLCTAALFADADNDGDPDLLLARSLERSRYLLRDGDRYRDASDRLDVALPAFATSLAAADVDLDGLLDFYVATYGIAGRELKDPAFARRFLDEEQVRELFRRKEEADRINPYFAASGVPNLLLRNAGGGRLVRSEHDEALDHWVNTFQALFADLDEDGDPDLYLANDYASDRVYRNDLEDGFTDVTREVGGDELFGFGMGVTAGDLDGDGDLDLYVSNMFSKAGRRITERLDGLDWRIARLSEGNLLLENRLERGRPETLRFERRSGPGQSHEVVAHAGWSWGGTFLDFDADGFLDLYVSSGNYTAPQEIAFDVDL